MVRISSRSTTTTSGGGNRRIRRRLTPTATSTPFLAASTQPAFRNAATVILRKYCCVSWRVLLLGLICVYVVVMVVVILTLDEAPSSLSSTETRGTTGAAHNHPGILPHKVSQFVRKVEDRVGQFENQVLRQVWTTGGGESAQNQEEFETLSSTKEIQHLQQVETDLTRMYAAPQRNPQLCRRLHQNSWEVHKHGLTNILAQQDDGTKPQYALDILSSCHELNRTKEYYFYNPFRQPRHVCDFQVPAHGVQRITSDMWHSDIPPEFCAHMSSLYTVLPDQKTIVAAAASQSVDPVITIRENDSSCTGEDFSGCNVPCQHCGRHSLITQRTIEGLPFRFTFSMEGESYYQNLKVNPIGWTSNQYYATTSFDSDIPLPYFSFAEYDIVNGSPPVAYDTGIKGAVFIARNCGSHNKREKVVKELQDLSDIFRIDSVSSCLHNAEPPNGVSKKDKKVLMRQYLFYLAFENQNTKDYVTEKLWGAYVAGVVPVYLGAPNIKELVPDNSIISVSDFASTKDLALYLQKVASDPHLYQSFHAWRYQPLPAHFLQKYNMTRTHNVCRSCRWAYAKRHGLGWSHERQEIVDLHIPRHSCRDADGMLTWPVRERWFQSQGGREGFGVHPPTHCRDVLTEPWEDQVDIASHWERTIHEHDGVIDLHVQRKHHNDIHNSEKTSHEEMVKNPVVLELVLPFVTDDHTLEFRQIEAGHLQWQNTTSRMTVLIKPAETTPIKRWDTHTNDQRTMAMLHIRHPTAVRIFTEDVDRFHAGASRTASYFGQTMKEEWENPLEIFMVDAPSR